MQDMNYLKKLVEEFHSTVVATIDHKGLPQTRAIDMMLYDEKGLYFLTAKGKDFYQQLINQHYISLTALKNKKAISYPLLNYASYFQRNRYICRFT